MILFIVSAALVSLPTLRGSQCQNAEVQNIGYLTDQVVSAQKWLQDSIASADAFQFALRANEEVLELLQFQSGDLYNDPSTPSEEWKETDEHRTLLKTTQARTTAFRSMWESEVEAVRVRREAYERKVRELTQLAGKQESVLQRILDHPVPDTDTAKMHLDILETECFYSEETGIFDLPKSGRPILESDRETVEFAIMSNYVWSTHHSIWPASICNERPIREATANAFLAIEDDLEELVQIRELQIDAAECIQEIYQCISRVQGGAPFQ